MPLLFDKEILTFVKNKNPQDILPWNCICWGKFGKYLLCCIPISTNLPPPRKKNQTNKQKQRDKVSQSLHFITLLSLLLLSDEHQKGKRCFKFKKYKICLNEILQVHCSWKIYSDILGTDTFYPSLNRYDGSLNAVKILTLSVDYMRNVWIPLYRSPGKWH